MWTYEIIVDLFEGGYGICWERVKTLEEVSSIMNEIEDSPNIQRAIVKNNLGMILQTYER